MATKKSLVFIVDAHIPFVCREDMDGLEGDWFFNALSFTYLPLLRACTHLEQADIPFKFGIAFNSVLCEMLSDEYLQDKYIEVLDKSINFGKQELERCKNDQKRYKSITDQLKLLELNRFDFVISYNKNIIQKFDYFAVKGCIEILATTATYCFLPFYADIPEAISAQIEVGLINYRTYFSKSPVGFWLPAMAYTAGLEKIIKSYGLKYTVLDMHSFVLAEPPTHKGVFCPAAADNGFIFLAKDSSACAEITDSSEGAFRSDAYLNMENDLGYTLDKTLLEDLFDVSKGRRQTGFRYFSNEEGDILYDPKVAFDQVEKDAENFLNSRQSVLTEIESLINTKHIGSVCCFSLTFLGQQWFEGIRWFETIFKKIAQSSDLTIALPEEFAFSSKQMQTIKPFFSSNLETCYAGELVDNSNDWMFSYVRKATERMVDLTERFPDDTGLKERILNMAAREVLLAQSMFWPLFSNNSLLSDFATKCCKDYINAFTIVYESLGSGVISTDWLTKRERQLPLFPEMNYRFFSKKK